MRIGAHVSIAGGIDKAPFNAAKIGAEIFQIFSRSPHGGPAMPITKTVRQDFKRALLENKQSAFYIHAPYFINLCSRQNNIYHGSISVVRQELERGSLLGASGMMTHLGSFGESEESEGILRVVQALVKILDGYAGETPLLIENSAGAGKIIGDSVDELSAIINDKRLAKSNIKICLDTCHLFASGYDIASKEGLNNFLKEFDKKIGLGKMALLHANDSRGNLGSKLDRHEHIGKGHIKASGFSRMAKDKALGKLDWILETPKEEGMDQSNIKKLKEIRGTKDS
jgi:deoxyribonuclease IV